MQKTGYIFWCLFLSPCLIWAQDTWHINLNTGNSFAPFTAVELKENLYEITTGNYHLIIDQTGTIRHKVKFSSSSFTSTEAIYRDDEPGYFQSWRLGNECQLIYRTPAEEEVHTLRIQGDPLNYPTRTHLPDVKATSDSTLLLFGRKYYYKFAFNPETGFSRVWRKPFKNPCVGVAQSGEQFITSDTLGWLMAFNAEGQTLWEIADPAYVFTRIIPLPNGFIGIRRVNGANFGAHLYRFDAIGRLLWHKFFPQRLITTGAGTKEGNVFVAVPNSTQTELHYYDLNGDTLQIQTHKGSVSAMVVDEAKQRYFLVQDVNGKAYATQAGFYHNGPIVEIPNEESTRILENDQIQVAFNPRSVFFSNDNDELGGLIVKSDTAATIRGGGIFFGGKDQHQQLRVANTGVWHSSQLFSRDFRVGTYHTDEADFQRAWMVNQNDIRELQRDFATDQSIDGEIPFDILTWPGKGNPHFRFRYNYLPVTSDKMNFPAPFYDQNGDGSYNVYDGDYPLVKGERTAWWVFCDSTQHGRSGGNIVGIDVMAQMYFLPECTANPILQKTVFLDLEIINSDTLAYEEAFFTWQNLFQLGCNRNDRYGRDTIAHTTFAFTEPEVNVTNCSDGRPFVTKPPVQTVTFIDTPMSSGFDSASGNGLYHGPSNFVIGDDDQEIWNNMNGRWRHGAALTQGFSGFAPPDSIRPVVQFTQPGNPSDPTSWSYCAPNYYSWQYPTHYVSLMNQKPFAFMPGDTFRTRLQFSTFDELETTFCPDFHGEVRPQLLQIRDWHQKGYLDARLDLGAVKTLKAGEPTIQVGNPHFPDAAWSWSNGMNTPTIAVAVPGTYTATVTLPNGCTLTDQVQVVSEQPPADDAPLLWAITPNPGNGRVKLQFPAGLSGLELDVFAATGQLARHFVIPSSGGTFDVDLSTLPNGIYFLAVRTVEGRYSVKRYLKT
jgi:hypothetical protein